MTAIDLRKTLHKDLDKIKDENILKDLQLIISSFLSPKQKKRTAEIQPISLEEYHANIEKGLKDIKEGRVHSETEIDQYLNRYK
jgi:predicted transcriptional regulator